MLAFGYKAPELIAQIDRQKPVLPSPQTSSESGMHSAYMNTRQAIVELISEANNLQGFMTRVNWEVGVDTPDITADIAAEFQLLGAALHRFDNFIKLAVEGA